MKPFLYLCSALSLAHVAWGKLYTDPSQLPKTSYDFVIVGAGTAGNVVARRLADSSFSVLVIEAGINNDNTLLQVPYLAPTLLSNSSLYWNYNTVPQTGLNSRTLAYARGRLLGGSSSVNFMIYTRGSKDDFDRIASVTGDSGWSWNSILPFIKNAEKFTQPTDGHNTTGQYNPSVHGFSGLLKTDVGNSPTEIDSRIVATTKTNPSQFPFNLDGNSGNTIGVGWTQYTSGGGERSSSATAYLQPAIAKIDVLIQTQVTKLINVAGAGKTPDLRKVEFAQSSSGQRFTVTATKEVILSAGAINTPQILLLSGVGDQAALSKLGISVVAKSPSVGQNLQDHPLLTNTWTVNSNGTADPIARNSTIANALLQQWTSSRTGPFSDLGPNLVGWLRLPSNSAAWQGASDPSAGPTSAHFELLPAAQFVSFLAPAPSTGSYLSMLVGVISPASRGSVTLTSTDPFTFPKIDPAFLVNPLDSRVMLEAVKASKALVATSPWNGYIVAPYGSFGSATTDAQLLDYIRNGITTFWHPTSTAKMGKSSDSSAVVDPQLLVKGVQGVRVVDASVFPYIPAGHPQGAIYAIAERAANLISTKWKSNSKY